MTLSYGWGSSLPLKTTSFNIDEHCVGIPFEAFPKTLKDAIIVTKRLNFRYLWIDALCIIQGDEEDWAEQAVAMTEIYQGSTLTISALSSRDCDYGILTKLPDYGLRIGTYFNLDDNNGRGDIFVGVPNKVLDLEAKYLSSRGWAFQERLVSVASLHYTDEGMVWECASGVFLEHDQGYRQFEWKSEWKSLTQSQLSQSQKMNSQEDQYDFWNRWVGEFSERSFTYNKDRLPAIAGIAKSFANKFQLTYIAGLWEENMISGLLWQRHHSTISLTRFDESVAPSWSWASVQGRLKYRNLRISASNSGLNLRILERDVREDQPRTFGAVCYGKIEAEGLLQEVVIDRSIHPTVRQLPHQECGVVEGVADAKFICMLDVHKESADTRYRCWCLRVGTYNAHGRESAVFLLLQKVDSHETRFCRVGLAEVDAWNSNIYVSAETNFFLSGQWLRFTLV